MKNAIAKRRDEPCPAILRPLCALVRINADSLWQAAIDILDAYPDCTDEFFQESLSRWAFDRYPHLRGALKGTFKERLSLIQ